MARSEDKLTNEEWVTRKIRWFTRHRSRYVQYADILQQVLETAANRYAPLAIVQARAKTVASFAEKVQRKIDKYRKHDRNSLPLHPITDLCGARVITHTLTQVEAVSRFIKDHFEIDEGNSLDMHQRLQPNAFGYLSVHYIVRFRPGVFPTKHVPVRVPKSVYGLDAEVQVRTIVEHAWAGIHHEIGYKGKFEIPEKHEREFARLAATLEDVDEAFCRLESDLSRYAASYGDYMSREQMLAELAKLQVVLQASRRNAEVAHRVAMLAICLGNWRLAVKVLKPFVRWDMAPLLRDLGVAMCKLYKKGGVRYRQGQKYLKQAIKLAPCDSDAIASLGGTWKDIDEKKANELYRRAFEADSTDAYPLENFLTHEIRKCKSLTPISLAMPSIRTAIKRCRDQIDVSMNLPWAFYSIGRLQLIMREPYLSLFAYTKAVRVSANEGMIDTSLQSLEKLDVVKKELPGYEWIRRFLILASNAARAANGKRFSGALKALACARFKPLRSPIVMIVGDTNGKNAERLSMYRDLFVKAFRDFKGTVISGGTVAGISRLAGDLGEKYSSKIKTIGYAPSMMPAESPIESNRGRYHGIRCSNGHGFSPLEPIQAWVDILLSGIVPTDVKVLGVGGGAISAAEYRIALGLGAKVAVVRDSGGAVREILSDQDWASEPTLLGIPEDAMTLKVFLNLGISQLTPDVRDTIAKAIHERYVQSLVGIHPSNDLSLTKWEDLPKSLQESNRQQADHIPGKLRQFGYIIGKPKSRKLAPIKFADDEVEAMAEMEHGRWNVERLLNGWTLGEKKDVARKISPYLVGWSELPEEIKKYDRQTVRAIPEFLAKVGLTVLHE